MWQQGAGLKLIFLVRAIKRNRKNVNNDSRESRRQRVRRREVVSRYDPE